MRRERKIESSGNSCGKVGRRRTHAVSGPFGNLGGGGGGRKTWIRQEEVTIMQANI